MNGSESDLYRFRVWKGKQVEGDDSYTSYKFSFQSYDAIAEWGMQKLFLSIDEKNNSSSLLDLSMEGYNRLQIADYLNSSIEELQRYELQQKNLMAINTIEFIDGQLIQIESALRNSEDALEEFRANNLIVDLSAESEQMLEYFIELEQEERSQLNLQRSFYRYVLEFLQSKQTYSGLSLPTLSSFNDALVAQLAEQLIESSVQLEKYRYSLEGTNPAIIELEKEVQYTKQALVNATQNALSSSDIVLDDVNKRIGTAQSKISKLPATEQQLINIQRQYEISGGQYELLLEKRAEAEFYKHLTCPIQEL